MPLRVSAIICAYSDDREEQLKAAIGSVLNQETAATEILLVIDHNPGLMGRMMAAFPDSRIIANIGQRGLSGARNTGLRAARGDVVAFVDDDAVADRQWLTRMIGHYADPSVIGVGGGVVPVWSGGKPPWFPEEFNWVVGCSYRGQPEGVARVRNPIGCNMSFRREIFDRIGGFREGVGRTADDAAGCEETEFFIRARQAYPESSVLLDPAMRVHHQVAPERGRWNYFRKRCIAEGRSKTLVVNEVGAADGLAAERSYVLRTLPAGFFRGIAQSLFKFDPWGLARAGGIVAGLGFTTWGYLGARLAGGRR
ncbi:MAG: glycosyltransferase family 2 protein [Rhizobiales bacterium]|nr:glycosyltransferase family 2 protein [Hyphomicrobiales bacterium]MBI3672934.1 glycosyltransferase family 2 protein [Hyphomicrobiales bacterium]